VAGSLFVVVLKALIPSIAKPGKDLHASSFVSRVRHYALSARHGSIGQWQDAKIFLARKQTRA
jgi:hypothetical protein